jgi:hypothetical protein
VLDHRMRRGGEQGGAAVLGHGLRFGGEQGGSAALDCEQGMGGGRVSRGLGGGRASRGKGLGQPRRSTAAVAAVYRVHEEEGWTLFFQKYIIFGSF